MRIAFYAPLNPPDGPTPSGDRLIGRMLMQALRADGHEVAVASRFRTFDRMGDAVRQARIAGLGARLAMRFLRRRKASPPDLWLTYHLYHKAPDHIGPIVARGFGIPYVVVEASVTPDAAQGPWSEGYKHVIRALGDADLVIGINPKDRLGVVPHLGPDARYAETAVFIDGAAYRTASGNREAHRTTLQTATGAPAGSALLLAVGMMRSKDKLDSIRLLAEALRQTRRTDWHLGIAGDGPLEHEAIAAFATLKEHVTFLGRIAYERLPALYAAADLLVWPAIKEALGMCFLESQAAGTPVIGARREGVSSIIRDGITGLLPAYGDASAFARAIDELLVDRGRLETMRPAAAANALERHDLTTAGRRFAALVTTARRPSR